MGLFLSWTGATSPSGLRWGGIREMALLAARIVSEMAADHEHGGDHAGAAVLREAVKQIASVPENRP